MPDEPTETPDIDIQVWVDRENEKLTMRCRLKDPKSGTQMAGLLRTIADEFEAGTARRIG